ncbi:MAG: PRD domain-containing protein, partial [Tetragenococcus koreensis]|nr:PRD domain-containing protein [Tetragenococcus koreensis]
DKNKKMQDMENDILEIIKNKRVEAYLCSLKVKQFIEKNYQYELTNEEILYLTIHISRMTQKLPMEE